MTIQIIGTGPQAHMVPPETGAERWGMNNPWVYRARCPQLLKTWTRWFNVHSTAHITKAYPLGYAWYQKQDGSRPIYLRDGPDESIAGSQRFPGPELQRHFALSATEDEQFFDCSLAWLMAFAVREYQQPRIELWGFGFQQEYFFERDAAHYWTGRARQAGCEVILPPEVNIARATRLYGYETT